MTSTFGHMLRPQHADLAQLEGYRHAVLARKLLGQGVAEPHMHRALDLRLALLRIQRPADIVGGDHAFHGAGLAEHHHLRAQPKVVWVLILPFFNSPGAVVSSIRVSPA